MNQEQVVYNKAKMWQIAFFALNNTATNVFFMLMMYVSYYVNGIAGIAVVTVSFLLTAMRIFDGFTDPVIGYIIDKTDTKFGKFRPTIALGYTIIVLSVLLLFNTLHKVPSGLRVIYFIFVYGMYIIGYTFQTACTKAAQTCLTNDPKQRPKFTLFDGIYNIIMFAGSAIYVSNYLVPKHGGFTLPMFEEFVLVCLIGSGVMTVLALIGIAQKDKKEFFGLGAEGPKVEFKDYVDVIKNNRAIQMLIFAASTDKLAGSTMRHATVLVIIFGIVAGDYGLSGQISAITILPTLLVLMIGIRYAGKLGQKQALVGSTWLAIVFGTLVGGIVLFGDMTTLSFSNVNTLTIVFCITYILMGGFAGISGNIVIPMIADCADYETYRSGRYVPGMMGTLFSFIDKMVSSFATSIVGLTLALVGFNQALPTVDTPLSNGLLYAGVFLFVGLPILGWIISLVAMKFYPLDAEKMKVIQKEIQRIKENQTEENTVA